MVSIVSEYPALVLVSVFSHWMMGPVNSSFNWNCNLDHRKNIYDFNNQNNMIHVSFYHTWINIIIKGIGAVIFTLLCLDINKQEFWFGYGLYEFGFIYVVLIYLASIFFFALIQIIEKWETCWCAYCSKKCFPITKITIVAVENGIVNIIEEDEEKYQRSENIDMDKELPSIIWQSQLSRKAKGWIRVFAAKIGLLMALTSSAIIIYFVLNNRLSTNCKFS